MHFNARRRALIAMSSFAAYRKPGVRDGGAGDTGNANAGGGGNAGTGTGQGNGTGDQGGSNNAGGSGQQGGQSGGQQQNGQQGGNQGGQNGGQDDAQTVEQLPPWAQNLIGNLRRENAAKRTGGNDGGQGQQNNGQQQGGQNNTGQQGQQNNQAQSDADIEAAQATARDSVLQLAAYRAAGTNGADPDLLLDSRTFVEKLSKLDPTSDGFNTKLTEAIKKAVEDNPKLRSVQAAGRSGGEFTGGPTGGQRSKPKSLRDAYSGHYSGK